MSPRQLFNGFLTVALLAALILIGRVLIAPDAGASLFSRARQLEEAGQISLALRHYALVSDRHPESGLAPQALLKQGDLLSARGRTNKNTGDLRNAMNAYARLAQNYPDNNLGNAALFDAGQIAAEDLSDGAAARRFYRTIMARNSDRSDEAAMATTKLGRLAIDEGDGKTALQLLQSVIVNWPNDAEASAEAQFHLGVLYETLLKQRDKAQRAYDRTLTQYPKSVWAGEARQRLGLLAYNDQLGRRPVRRVLLDIAPLPQDDGLPNPQKGGDLWAALDILLGARGLSVDNIITRGWSLEPFWAGIDRNDPGRVVAPSASFDPFANVVANAGLRFTLTGGGKAEDALRQLQNDLDSARQPLLYLENGGEGRWALCVGYDSERGEVYLQDRGAQFDTLAVESFAKMWKAKSKFGRTFTMLSFVGQGEKPRALQQLSAGQTPAPDATAAPTPAFRLNATPQFIWELPRLKQSSANSRALRRAAQQMNRTGDDAIALNVAGLNYLARELTRIADSPDPNAFGGFEQPPARQEPTEPTQATQLDANAVAIPLPTATATPAPRDFAPRARSLMAFFGEPARNWARKRRRAAAFCEVAARQNKGNLNDAISNFGLSADSLDAAAAIAPLIGATLTDNDRAALREMARQISVARDAEAAAARALS